jgi:hypothetical protein
VRYDLLVSRWFAPLIVVAGCASEPAPLAAASAPCPVPMTAPEPELGLGRFENRPEARSVPMQFETRRIGPSSDSPSSRWVGRPIDLDVKDADLQDVFRLLSDVGHVNIVVGDNVAGRVTLRLKHVPWDQALDTIATAKGLAVERDSGIVLVTAAGAPKRER